MKLDISYNNELVFSNIFNKKAFVEALQRGKGLTYRNVHGNFYISLEHLNTTREVLKSFSSQFTFAPRYQKFAERFIKNKKCVEIIWYPSVCEISGNDLPWHKIIPITKYFNKAALQNNAYKKGLWDGNSHLFDVVKGEFPAGLLQRIMKVLEEEGVPFIIEKTFKFPSPRYIWNPTFEFEPTPDQIDAVSALHHANSGIAKLPTGFGKTSYVAAALISKKGVKSLFLANQRVLIHDAKRDFESVFQGEKIGVIGDGEFELENITVASIQGIVSALKKPTRAEYSEAKINIDRAQLMKDEKELTKATKKLNKLQEKEMRAEQLQEYLNSVELFIVDESQVLGTDMWNTFLNACPAPYRYTLSATDTRGDGGRILIVAATGERVYESSAAEQIEKGRLAEFRGKFKKFDHKIPRKMARDMKLDFHQAYNIFIMNNELRNEHLCDVVIDYVKQNFSVIALVTRVDHAEIIQNICVKKGLTSTQCPIVTGSTSRKSREALITGFRNGDFPVLIGSSIFDVGFNAKNAARMVRFNAGSSEVREPQRAGRTVRMREDGSHGETYDIYDINVPFFEFQANKRMQALRDEFGYQRVEILPGIIEGEINISALKEVAEQIPETTDRIKTEEIINQLSHFSEAIRPRKEDVNLQLSLDKLLDNK